MTVNLNVPYLHITGEPIIEAGKPVTLRDGVVNSLVNPLPGGDGVKMLARFDLALRISKEDGDLEIKESEKEMILESVRSSGITLAYGTLYHLFNDK